MQQGIQKGRLEIAKKLLRNRRLSLEMIAETTDLTTEELAELACELENESH